MVVCLKVAETFPLCGRHSLPPRLSAIVEVRFSALVTDFTGWVHYSGRYGRHQPPCATACRMGKLEQWQ